MFLRALVAFLVCPGLVAYCIPGLLVWRTHVGPWSLTGPGLLGVFLLTFGTSLLLWCVRDFYVTGRGTLGPWAPPETLVRVGLYRISRNPMYLAVGVILSGWAVTFSAFNLFLYGCVVMVAFHLRVVLGEEPWLARRHGEAWEGYQAEVPRWLRLGFGVRARDATRPPGAGGQVESS